MKIAIVDILGLTYDGNTLNKRGLGGSESAVILISQELVKLGFDVTVYNNCIDSEAEPGVYNGVKYVDHSQADVNETYDIFISSRTTEPFWSGHQYVNMAMSAKWRVIWMHDTFCRGDESLEAMIMQGFVDEVFTLSDFHSWYVTSCDHGHKRSFEILKHKFFHTRNGAVKHIPQVNVADKNPKHFVYNASATKGLIPLIHNIWPEILNRIPDATLTCIGGFYRFREGAEPDEQEKMVNDLIKSNPKGVTFTGVIPQYEIAKILADATMMLYPTAFPETFGISSLESLLYRTPIVTNVFGALEETAIDLACYKIPYSSTKNYIKPDLNEQEQQQHFVNMVIGAVSNQYLHYQKQHYCDVVDDIYGWDTIALQWKQHFYNKFDIPLPVEEYRRVSRINDKVARVFGRRFSNEEERRVYKSYSKQRRISVISPVRNAEDFVKQHCLSVWTQDYDDWMHWIIDDASDDNTLKIIEEERQKQPDEIRDRIQVIANTERKGAVRNQIESIRKWVAFDDIVMLLDGDDWLKANNSIFHFYNDLYDQGYDFTYGSMWSLADNIPLIAQDWEPNIQYAWKIPYTHIRTFSGYIARKINKENYIVDGKWMMAGADNPLFRETISYAGNPKAVKEIVVNYNDINPNNDYKVNSEEQNKNAAMPIKGEK